MVSPIRTTAISLVGLIAAEVAEVRADMTEAGRTYAMGLVGELSS